MKTIIIMLLCLTMMGCSSITDDDDDVVEKVRAGDRLPVFSVTVTADGQQRTFSTEKLTGEIVIVLFSSTCKDCQRELPRLNDYYLKHRGDEGFQMVAISRAEGESVVAPFWKEYNLSIPYSAQEDRRIYELFASSIVPRVYFSNAQGIVTRVYIERLPTDF